MNLDQLKNAIKIFYPAIVLDGLVSRKTRVSAGKVLQALLFIFWIITAIAEASKLPKFPWRTGSEWVAFLQQWEPVFMGALFISVALWLLARAFESFYDSYYFIGLQTILPEAGLSEAKPPITFEAAEVLNSGFETGDFTGAFLRSRLGGRVCMRLGFSRKTVEGFLSARLHVVGLSVFKFPELTDTSVAGFSDLAKAVIESDAEFFKFLSTQNVSEKDFVGASDWVEQNEQYFRRHDRFWSKDSLGKISGIGKDWSYGGAYALEKYAHDITEHGADPSMAGAHVDEQEELEAVLARSGEANALLVADEGVGALGIVYDLGSRITQGSVLPPLEHKRVYLLDTNALVNSSKDKGKFEGELLHLLNSAVRSGHIILVIPDLPHFIESAQSIGADVMSLMDSYLALAEFQVIALSNPGAFHQGLEGNSKILHRFEKILVKDRDEKSTLRALEEAVLTEESKGRVFFTYQSLATVAEGARRYFSDGVTSDKAIHLLAELVPHVQAKKKNFVERSDVLELLEIKTGIPTGDVSVAEKEKLLHLEDILHKRIIGQDEAIKAISNAMRRARSDIENPERPMGSFLFLGPTGVGKTETTKALAATFFGKEDSVIRLDMSEYRTDDALKRLTGSFEDGKVGVLSAKLRERSYGVLLLDEFEKTSKEVLDLFLQILDEGFFSDMSGRRVNARNLIIIATSNAGSDLIWKTLRGTDADSRGQNADGQVLNKDAVINEIINRGIFKPELLNRFDGVILFHPLSTKHLQEIAGLMLKKLQKRLMEKGIEFVINDAVLKAVMSAGTDQQFGARPMNRAIQEKIEQVIAQKIISGEAKAGSRIEFTAEELSII